ncbi:uncharacterized protein LOC134857047 isoform X2 [Symsagittifera roscoffensis]|uniref:uncharacterized protein LOC134857047 isoform X2 n=1 Tax=Symsagittifera roscoffensis TaxID=84072 RepID=UPI00307C723C
MVYLGWANTVLREEKESAASLRDFQDGRLLCLLADILTKSSLTPKWHSADNTHSKQQAKEVIENLFDYLRCEGAEVDVSSEEIMKAEETAVLDILWILMLHFCICDCELEPEEKCLAYGKLWLMDWIVEIMPECGVNPEKDELQTVFKSSHNLAMLIDKVCPDSAARSKPDKPLLNLTYALMFAEDRLSMSQNILKANEVIDGVCPDYALVIYTALLKRKYDILNHSDSSSSQFGRRNNLFSDKEIILEERSKEDLLDGAEQSRNLEEDLDDDEKDRTGNLELRSKSLLDEVSSDKHLSMVNEPSRGDEDEIDGEGDEYVLIGDEASPDLESEFKDAATNNEGMPLSSGDVHTKTGTPERTEHSERMLAKGSIESVSGAGGNKSFEPFSDSAANELQTEVYQPIKVESKPPLSDVGEDEIIVVPEDHRRELESAPVSVSTPLNVQARFGDNMTMSSEKPGPASFSTKVSTERETNPFSSSGMASSKKENEYLKHTGGATYTEFTHVSSNKAIDTSDEDIGTLKSEAPVSRNVDLSPTRNAGIKKKFNKAEELKEGTNESNESIGPIGLSERNKYECKLNQTEVSANAEVMRAELIPAEISASEITTDETVTGKYALLPGRPTVLKMKEKEIPTIKRSTSPTNVSEHGVTVKRSHSRTTSTATPVFESEQQQQQEIDQDMANRKAGPGLTSGRSSRRGSFDSFSSESMFHGVATQDNEGLNQGSVNGSLIRESAHGTPVHMIGVRASPSNDPLFQLLDNISKRGESLRSAVNDNQMSTQTLQNIGDQDMSRMEALNGIVTNLETQIEILSSENERLKSEIQRVEISSMEGPMYKESVSLNAQVEFLDGELAKYKSENENLKLQMDALRDSFLKQEQILRIHGKNKSGASSVVSKGFSQLEPLMEGSHESLDKSISSSRRTPRASTAEDPLALKEAEIAQLTLELEEVLETNDVVIEELERVKTLFTRTQIEEIRSNLDAEIEKAKKGESEHPQQTLEELAVTIQRLEESVAAQSSSYKLNGGIMDPLNYKKSSSSAALIEIATARMRRKLNSDAAVQNYSGQVDQYQRPPESTEFESLMKTSSFTPLEASPAVSELGSTLPRSRERPYSAPQHKLHRSNLIRPVAQSVTISSPTPELKRSTVSLPAAFSPENSPRTLSKESLRYSNHQLLDAQVQTNLSVSSQYEPSKLSMSTQTQVKEDQKRSNGYPQMGFTAPYPYGTDITGTLPRQVFPNVAVQTTNQVEGAIETLPYDALRSYTRNLSMDAVHGGVTVPNAYPNQCAFNQGQAQSFACEQDHVPDRQHFSHAPTRDHEEQSRIYFHDRGSAAPQQNGPNMTQLLNRSFENFETAVRTEAQSSIPGRFYPSMYGQHNYYMGNSNPNIAALNQGLSYDMRNTISSIVQDEVQRAKDDELRGQSVILNELALRSAQRNQPQRSAYEFVAPRNEYIPPIEELVMKRYRNDSEWKIPPSNIEELLKEYGIERRKPKTTKSFDKRAFMQSNLEHNNFGSGSYEREIGSGHWANDRNLRSSYNEHESDELCVPERERYSKNSFSARRDFVSDRSNSPPERERSCSSPLNRSNLSPYEFINSVPVKLNFKRPPLVWGSGSYR